MKNQNINIGFTKVIILLLVVFVISIAGIGVYLYWIRYETVPCKGNIQARIKLGYPYEFITTTNDEVFLTTSGMTYTGMLSGMFDPRRERLFKTVYIGSSDEKFKWNNPEEFNKGLNSKAITKLDLYNDKYSKVKLGKGRYWVRGEGSMQNIDVVSCKSNGLINPGLLIKNTQEWWKGPNTEGWNEYRSDAFGLTFKYPESMIVTEESSEKPTNDLFEGRRIINLRISGAIISISVFDNPNGDDIHTFLLNAGSKYGLGTPENIYYTKINNGLTEYGGSVSLDTMAHGVGNYYSYDGTIDGGTTKIVFLVQKLKVYEFKLSGIISGDNYSPEGENIFYTFLTTFKLNYNISWQEAKQLISECKVLQGNRRKNNEIGLFLKDQSFVDTVEPEVGDAVKVAQATKECNVKIW